MPVRASKWQLSQGVRSTMTLRRPEWPSKPCDKHQLEARAGILPLAFGPRSPRPPGGPRRRETPAAMEALPAPHQGPFWANDHKNMQVRASNAIFARRLAKHGPRGGPELTTNPATIATSRPGADTLPGQVAQNGPQGGPRRPKTTALPSPHLCLACVGPLKDHFGPTTTGIRKSGPRNGYLRSVRWPCWASLRAVVGLAFPETVGPKWPSRRPQRAQNSCGHGRAAMAATVLGLCGPP